MDVATRLAPGLRADKARDEGHLLAALVVLAGLVVTVPIYLVIYHQQSMNRSAAALAMSSMGMQNMSKFWAFPMLQATGLAGLLFAWFSVFLGLQQSGRVASWTHLTYKQVDRLHRYLSLLVITEVVLHIVATTLDAMGDSWRSALLLNQQTWAPGVALGYNTGVIALYVLAITAPTFYVRRGIGASRWRMLHRLVIVFYVLALWHTLILGADVAHYAWMRPLVWLAQVPLLGLMIRRIHQPARVGEIKRGGRATVAARYSAIALSAAAILAVLIIVLGDDASIIHNVQ